MKRMKALLFILLFIRFSLAAQTDTLNGFFPLGGQQLIASPNGGYVSGMNGFGDEEKLQLFFNQTQAYSLTGAILDIGFRSPNPNSESFLCLKIKQIDTTVIALPPFIIGPSLTIDSIFYPLADIPESGLIYIPFNQPVLVTQPYALGISFEQMQAGDSIAVFSTANGVPETIGLSWEKWNNRYFRIIDTWELSIDFAIFPVIDTTLNKMLPMGHEHINVAVYPNPASDFLEHHELDVSHALILDISGRVVFQEEFPKNRIFLTGLHDGVYTLILSTAKGYRLARFIKATASTP